MPSDQHLYFRELELNGSSTLAQCDIPPGATLFLKVRAPCPSPGANLQTNLVASRTLTLQTDDPIAEEGCSFSEPLGKSPILFSFPN